MILDLVLSLAVAGRKNIDMHEVLLGILGVHLSAGHHSLHELLRAADFWDKSKGSVFNMRYVDGFTRYHQVGKLGEPELRLNVALNGLFPDEIAFNLRPEADNAAATGIEMLRALRLSPALWGERLDELSTVTRTSQTAGPGARLKAWSDLEKAKRHWKLADEAQNAAVGDDAERRANIAVLQALEIVNLYARQLDQLGSNPHLIAAQFAIWIASEASKKARPPRELNAFRRMGSSRDTGLDPIGLPLGHALVIERPRTDSMVAKAHPSIFAALTDTGKAVSKRPQFRSWIPFQFPDVNRSHAWFGYDVSDTGDIRFLEGGQTVDLTADDWIAYGDDFIHLQEGVLLYGDTGWIARIDNWPLLRDSLSDPQANHGVRSDGRAVYVLPLTDTAGFVVRLPLTTQAPVGSPSAFLDAPRPVQTTVFNTAGRLGLRSMPMNAAKDTAVESTLKGEFPVSGSSAPNVRSSTINTNKATAQNAVEQRQQLKHTIEHDFGIRLDSPAGAAAVRQANPGMPLNEMNKVQGMQWDLHSLKQLYAALQHYAPIMGRWRARSSRSGIEQEVVIAGLVTSGVFNQALNPRTLGEYFAENRLMNLYKVVPEAEIFGINHKTLIFTHELAHGLLRYALEDFKEQFWKDIEAPLITASGKMVKNREEDLHASIMAYLTLPAFKTAHPRHAQAIRELRRIRSDLFVKYNTETLGHTVNRIAAALSNHLAWFGAQVGAWASDGSRYWPVEPPSTKYGWMKVEEDFADSAMLWFNRQPELWKKAPKRAEFFQRETSRWNGSQLWVASHHADRLNTNLVPVNQLQYIHQARKTQSSWTGTRHTAPLENTDRALGPDGLLDIAMAAVKEQPQSGFERGRSPGEMQEQALMPGRWDSQAKRFVLDLDRLSPDASTRANQITATKNMLTTRYPPLQGGKQAVTPRIDIAAADLAQSDKLTTDTMLFASGLAAHLGSVELVLPNGQTVKVCA